jgi:parvulin-like peptidyl-prolyl isomerase
LVALSLAGCKGGKDEKGAGDTAVAATVNGKNILLREVDYQIKQSVGPQFTQLSPLQLAQARMEALDGLIQQEVLFQRADKEKLLPTEDEVTQQIASWRTQRRMTEEDYQRTLQESGQTEASLRELFRKQLAISKLMDKTVGKITIKDGEVVDFYNNNTDRFVTPRGVALSTIVADAADSQGVFRDDAKTDFEAQNKINEIYNRLTQQREDFATLARARSEDQSAAKSGELGFYTEEQLLDQRLPQEMVNAFFGQMPVGDVTKPVKLADGRWYIFKLNDRRLTAENQTLDTPGVKDQIKEYLIGERQKVMSSALSFVAMNEAKIVNNLANDILKDPNMLGGLTPAQPAQAARPAATPGAITSSNQAAPTNSAAGPAATPAAANRKK